MSLFRFLTGRKKTIDFELARYYPEGHRHSAEATHFGSKILSPTPGKIHSLCFDEQKWEKVGRKTHLRIIYRAVRNMQISTTLIKEFERIGIQHVVMPYPNDNSLLIDNKKIALDVFCRNEGLKEIDFRDWYKKDGGRKAVVVHFSDFRY